MGNTDKEKTGKVKNTRESFSLTSETCDIIADRIMEFCAGIGTERKEAYKYRISAEECLLYWMEHGCEGNNLVLTMGKNMLIPYISIEIEGEPLNPYSDDEEFGSFTDSIRVSMRLDPEYSYDKDTNRIRFRVKKKPLGQIATLAIAIVLALLVGILGMFLMSDGVRDNILTAVVNPIYNTFFNILGCIAGPMIFLSVAWGVYGIGNAATLGKIGKKMMLRYIGTTVFFCACCTVFFPLLGPGLSQGADAEGQFASIAELILGIFPSNIVEPFASGNILQIIFMAIIIGIALLYLGRKTSAIAKAIEQVNLLVQFLMEIISKLVPYVIFLVLVNMIWSGSISVMASAWKLILALIVAFFGVALCFLIMTSVSRRVKISILLKNCMPTFLVALTTASSAASFSSNVNTCEKKFGIDSSLIRFGIPLGMVMHKPISAVYNLLLIFFFAEKYDISCSGGWIVIAVIISFVLAIATPPIPGGGALAYSIIFAQMGIPGEAMAIALAIDIITDFLITSFEMFVLPLSLLNVSEGLGMLNRDILESKEGEKK